MISINSKILSRTLFQICRALGIPKTNYQAVTLESSPEVTSLRVGDEQARITCHIPHGGGEESISVPLSALKLIRSSKRHEVTFRSHRQRVQLRHWTGDGFCTTEVEAIEPVAAAPQPEWMLSNPRRLAGVLQAASELTTEGHHYLALNCLRLRGSDGQVAASDGRQAYTHAGFALPVDEVLVPAAPLRKLACLTKCSSITVGRSAEWLTLAMVVGSLRWTVDLKIDARSRYPNLDRCLPSLDYSRYEVMIADDDADYLLANLDRMIDSDDCLANLTFSAERRPGQPPRVVLRFRSRSAQRYSGLMRDARYDHSLTSQCVELDLAGSTFERGPMQIAIHHQHLLNALHLGLREFHVHNVSVQQHQ